MLEMLFYKLNNQSSVYILRFFSVASSYRLLKAIKFWNGKEYSPIAIREFFRNLIPSYLRKIIISNE